jgi:hypothetical protein
MQRHIDIPHRPIRLAVFVLSAATVVAQAQTNRSASLILPPADWDAGKHTLAALVTTNREGDYALPSVWAGVEQVTARAGWYATKDEVAKETGTALEFDKLTVGTGPVLGPAVGQVPPWLRGVHVISKAEPRNKHTPFAPFAIYRASLPSDAELLEMRDISSVTNIFAHNPFSQSTNSTAEAVGVRLFTLRPYDSMETLSVMFLRRNQEDVIDSILVKRARLHPQPKER